MIYICSQFFNLHCQDTRGPLGAPYDRCSCGALTTHLYKSINHVILGFAGQQQTP